MVKSFSSIINSFDKNTKINIDELLKLLNFVKNNIDTFQFNKHPLGFIHLKLFDYPNGGTLRLHIWDDNTRFYQKPFFPIHNHIFSFKSFVLVGSIINTTYKITSTKEKIYSLFSVSYDKKTSILKKMNSYVRIEAKEEFKVNTNEFYKIDKDIFHKSEVPKGNYTATLISTKDHKKVSPLVIGKNNADDMYIFERNNLSNSESFKAINKLLDYSI